MAEGHLGMSSRYSTQVVARRFDSDSCSQSWFSSAARMQERWESAVVPLLKGYDGIITPGGLKGVRNATCTRQMKEISREG